MYTQGINLIGSRFKSHFLWFHNLTWNVSRTSRSQTKESSVYFSKQRLNSRTRDTLLSSAWSSFLYSHFHSCPLTLTLYLSFLPFLFQFSYYFYLNTFLQSLCLQQKCITQSRRRGAIQMFSEKVRPEVILRWIFSWTRLRLLFRCQC